MAPKVPAVGKSERRAGKAKSAPKDPGRKKEEKQEKGERCDLYLQSVETGAPRHRYLQQSHGYHELVCQRCL